MKIAILLVDDEPSHRIISKRALKRVLPEAQLHECASLEEVIDFLSKRNVEIALAIVDLNLNGQSGLGVLQLLRSDNNFSAKPIILNSTSQLESDVYSSYAAGASTYIFKSDQPDVFMSEIGAATKFLLRT